MNVQRIEQIFELGVAAKAKTCDPHTRICLDVTDASGKVKKWECEGSAPGGLLSHGWSRESLRPGVKTHDRVAIECFPARDHSNICKARAVQLAGGARLIMEIKGA